MLKLLNPKKRKSKRRNVNRQNKRIKFNKRGNRKGRRRISRMLGVICKMKRRWWNCRRRCLLQFSKGSGGIIVVVKAVKVIAPIVQVPKAHPQTTTTTYLILLASRRSNQNNPKRQEKEKGKSAIFPVRDKPRVAVYSIFKT